jgi:hypothetical protein
MKFLPETTGIELLARARIALRSSVSVNEVKAKDCGACETRGSCCTDIHFVNVRITKLEAKVMTTWVSTLPTKIRNQVVNRVVETARELMRGGNSDRETEFYSCPLFHEDLGCIVHDVKPGACIHHACYERKEDLPPAGFLEEYEEEIVALNRRVYGKEVVAQSIPIALSRVWESSNLSKSASDDCDGKQQAKENRVKPNRN